MKVLSFGLHRKQSTFSKVDKAETSRKLKNFFLPLIAPLVLLSFLKSNSAAAEANNTRTEERSVVQFSPGVNYSGIRGHSKTDGSDDSIDFEFDRLLLRFHLNFFRYAEATTDLGLQRATITYRDPKLGGSANRSLELVLDSDFTPIICQNVAAVFVLSQYFSLRPFVYFEMTVTGADVTLSLVEMRDGAETTEYTDFAKANVASASYTDNRFDGGVDLQFRAD